MKAIIAGFIIIWLWVTFVMIAAKGQPAMPSTNRPAFKRPLVSPKAAGLSAGKPMAMTRTVSSMAIISTNLANMGISIYYSIPAAPSTNDNYVQFMSSADQTNWILIGRMPDFPGSSYTFTDSNHAPVGFYRAITVVGDVILTNIVATNNP